MNYKIIIRKTFFIFITIFIFTSISYGKEVENKEEVTKEEIENIKKSQNELIDYSSIQKAIDKTIQKDYNFDFKNIVSKIMSGEYDLEGKTLGRIIIDSFFKDLKDNTGLIIHIIIISIISAFFKAFSKSFENKQVSDMGFLIIFLIIIASVIQSYHILNSIAYDLIEKLIIFIEALVPSLLTVTVLSGSAASSIMFSESIIMLVGIINNIIKSTMLPFLYIIIFFTVLNTLTDEDNLGRIINLFKKGYEWAIKIILWIFVAVFGIQSFGLPVVDGLISRTAKQTINIVPVIGTSISEISDIVLGCGTLIKNAFGIGSIIAIVFVAILPVIKIGIIALLYKISAALIEPISESKLVNCLSNVGDICFLLLGTVLVVVLLFVIAIALTLYLTNIMLYIR